MSTINTNVQSLNAQRNLASSTGSLSTSMQRLSSGLRVNSAKDDAAGLAISERMNSQVKGMNVAIRNANDGISLAQTAEGALGKVGDMLQRVRELAVQSANATNSGSDRASLQAEAKQLKLEIQRVAEQTKFNGTNLLDGSFREQSFQVGANQGETISLGKIANSQIAALGEWTSADLPATATGSIPAGSGAAALIPATPSSSTVIAASAGTDGADDKLTVTFAASATQNFSLEINGEVTNAKIASALEAAFATGDTPGEATAAGFRLNLGGEATITAAIEQGTLKVERQDLAAFTISETTAGDDPAFDPANEAYGDKPTLGFGTTVAAGTAATPAVAATLNALEGNAFTVNGVNIEVGAADSAADRVTALAAKINKDVEGVIASVVEGQLTLTSNKAIEIGGGDADLVAEQTGLAKGKVDVVAGTKMEGFADLDISTAAGANNAILAMDAAVSAINASRGDLGAMQSRFENAISSLQVNSENTSAARGRIVDADFAKETSNLSRAQILQQAGTAMIAQANQLPQGVLSLLR